MQLGVIVGGALNKEVSSQRWSSTLIELSPVMLLQVILLSKVSIWPRAGRKGFYFSIVSSKEFIRIPVVLAQLQNGKLKNGLFFYIFFIALKRQNKWLHVDRPFICMHFCCTSNLKFTHCHPIKIPLQLSSIS